MKNLYTFKLIILCFSLVYFSFSTHQVLAQTVNKDFSSPQYQKAIEGIVKSSKGMLTAIDVKNILSNETDEKQITLSPDANSSLTVDPTVNLIEYNATTATFAYSYDLGDYASISLEGEITDDTDPGWCGVPVITENSENHGSISITVNQNLLPFGRYATLVVTAKFSDSDGKLQFTLPTTVYILQGPHPTNPYLSIVPEYKAVKSDVTSVEFDMVKFNLGTPIVSENNSDWITASNVVFGDNKIIISFTANPGQTSRTATLTIKDNDSTVSDELTIIQAGSAPFIQIIPEFRAVKSDVTSVEYDMVKFNIGTLVVSVNNSDWISTSNVVFGNDNITISFTTNPWLTSRTATLTISDPNSNVSDELTIIQAGSGPFIQVIPEFLAFPSGPVEETPKFNIVNFNIESWTAQIDIDDNWVTIKSQNYNKTEDNFITFTLEKNEGNTSRSAVIKIKDDNNSGNFDNLTIIQASDGPFISVIPEYTAINFEQQTTDHFDVIKFNIDDWVIENKNNLPFGITAIENHSNNSVKFNVPKNDSNTYREASIFIKDSQSEFRDEIKIGQGTETAPVLIVTPEVMVADFNAHNDFPAAGVQIVSFNIEGWVVDDNNLPKLLDSDDPYTIIDDKIYFNIIRNYNDTLREGFVTIKENNDSDISDTIQIIQGAEAVSTILVTPEVVVADFNAHTDFPAVGVQIVSFNIEGWVVDDDNLPKMLDSDDPYTIVDDKIYFNITRNYSDNFREGFVTIKENNDSGISDTIQIIQGAEAVSSILITPQIQSFSYEEQTTDSFNIIHFNITDWEVGSTLPNWVTVANSSHSGNDYIKFNIARNFRDQMRDTTIIIREKDNPHIADTLSIYQGAQSVSSILITPQIQSFSFEEQTSDSFNIIHFNITDWEIGSTLPNWVTVADSSHSGNDYIKFEIARNYRDQIRDTTIIIQEVGNTNVSHVLTIYQGAQSVSSILITPQIQSFSFEEQKSDKFDIINFNISDWELAPGTLPEWITVDHADHDADIITFNVLLNIEDNYRENTIIIREIDNPNVADTLTIYQGALSVSSILITPQIQSFSYEEQTSDEFDIIHFNIVDWEVGSTLPDWITVGDSSHGGNDYIKFEIARNYRDQMRNTTIIIREKNNPLIADTLSIYQGAQSVSSILITPQIQSFSYKEQTTDSFNIIHFNITDWEVGSTLPYWITVADSSHSGNDYIKFEIARNYRDQIRDTTIIIQEVGNTDVSHVLTIYQGAQSVSNILITPEIQALTFKEQITDTFNIIHFNVFDWQIGSILPDWLSVSDSDHNDSFDYILFHVAENINGSYRESTVIIQEVENPMIADTLTIYQGARAESVILVTPEVRHIGYEGGITSEFHVINFNIEDWRVADSANLPNGISVNTSTHTFEHGLLTFNVPENQSESSIFTNILIEEINGNPNVSDSLLIVQDAMPNPAILVAPRVQVIEWDYQAGPLPNPFIITPFNTNSLKYEINFYPTDQTGWLTTSGIEDNQLVCMVTDKNNTDTTRVAKIIFYDELNPAVADTINVYQRSSFEPYIILIPAAMNNIDSLGATLPLHVYSNLSKYYAIVDSTGTSWIELSKNTLAKNDSLFLTVSGNPDAFSPRSSKITFTNDTISEIFYLKQAKKAPEYIFIKGNVSSTNPVLGLSDVVLHANESVSVTDDKGNYALEVLRGWKGNIIPESVNQTHYFDPPQIKISPEVNVDTIFNKNFIAYLINPQVTLSLSESYICVGDSLLSSQFSRYPTPTITGTYGSESYRWATVPAGNENTISDTTILNPSFNPGVTTTYVLKLINNNDTVWSNLFTLNVKPRPEAITFNGETTVCNGQAGMVYYANDFSNGDNFMWNLPKEAGTFVNETNTNIAVINWGNSPGTYELSLTTFQDGCAAASDFIQTIDVSENAISPPPNNVYRKSNDNFLYCDDEKADEYRWGWFTLIDSKIVGEPYYIPKRSEWYCRLPDGYSANSDTNRYFVEVRYEGMECFSRSFYNVPVSIFENESKGIEVFPNPTDNAINVRFGNMNNSLHTLVKIYDFAGKVVFNKSFNYMNNTTLTINEARNFEAGIYLISIQSGSLHYTSKIIVH